MNYQESKTIHKVAGVTKGISGALLLTLLLASCLGNNQNAGAAPTKADPAMAAAEQAKKDFMLNKVGYFSDCGKVCLENQIIADALDNKDDTGNPVKKTVKIKEDSGKKEVETLAFPKLKDGAAYFATIGKQPTVGAKDRTTSGTTKKKLTLKEGINGALVSIYNTFLGDKNAEKRKNARFFVIAQYMDLSEKVTGILKVDNTSTETTIQELNKVVAEFTAQTNRVREKGTGVQVIISADKVTYLTPNKPITNRTISKNGIHHKHFVLDSTLEKKLDEVIKNLNNGIQELEKQLKTGVKTGLEAVKTAENAKTIEIKA